MSNSPFAYWFSCAIGACAAENAIMKRRERFAWVDFRWLVLFVYDLYVSTFSVYLVSSVVFAAITLIESFIGNRWHPIRFRLGRNVWNHLAWLGIIRYSVFFRQLILTQAGYLLGKLSLHQRSPGILMTTCLPRCPVILAAFYELYRLIEVTFSDWAQIFGDKEKRIWHCKEARSRLEHE